MYEFNYHRPEDLEEAQAIFDAAEEGKYLSGGQTLLPTLKQRLASPTDLIDLSGIDHLYGMERRQDALSIGAMTRHAEVAASTDVKASIPALAHLAGLIGDAQVRNRGTLGGSIANSDPSADYPAAVIALDATLYTPKRSIPADEYFQDLFETTLDEDEILTRIDFQCPRRAAYAKYPNPASRYAVVGVMVAQFDSGIHVGVTGAGACAFRSRSLEDALNADLNPAALDAVTVDHGEFNADLHASAEYRGHLVKVMTQRAVASLLQQ